MLAAALQSLFALALALPARWLSHPRAHKPHPVTEDDKHELWSWLEDHGDVVFPLVGLAVIALLFVGIRRGMTSDVAELRQREERKDDIVRMMRSRLLLNAEEVCQQLRIDRLQAAALLEDLLKDGKLVEQRGAGGVASYRLKGL